MNINQIVQNLLKLQALHFGAGNGPETEVQIAQLRGQIPPPILDHYDRLRARGKTGVSAVRNQVCAGCHVQVPRATVIQLMHLDDIQVCENCGRYLYLPDLKEPQPAFLRPAKKRAAKSPVSTEIAHAA